jgi:hypothetical protein
MVSVDRPGSIDELVADARSAGYQIGPRLITDWVAHGLLDRPKRRPKGRGHGSDKGEYAANQRRLFLTLLDKRLTSPHIRSLARIPLFIWLYWGDDYVPTRQALRAFTTWLGDFRVSKAAARKATQQFLGQLDNPQATSAARRELRDTLTAAAYCGRIDREQLRDAVAAVFEPGRSVIHRAIGPVRAPLTTDSIVELIEARLGAAQSVVGGDITEQQLSLARQAHLRHLAEYLNLLPNMTAEVPANLTAAFSAPTAQTLASNCGTDLLTVLGLQQRAEEL